MLKFKISPGSLKQAVTQITNLSDAHGKYVCAANTHMHGLALANPEFLSVCNNSLLTVADGRPLYWLSKWFGRKDVEHIRGCDLTTGVLREAERCGVKVGFYGGADDVLAALVKTVKYDYPKIEVVYAVSPPIIERGTDQWLADVRDIRASGAQVVFVGLGCPKQETWMADASKELTSVLVGVGAVFDFMSGHQASAPGVMQRLGLEWLHRLVHDPRRLAGRYFVFNTKFLAYVLRLAIRKTVGQSEPR